MCACLRMHRAAVILRNPHERGQGKERRQAGTNPLFPASNVHNTRRVAGSGAALEVTHRSILSSIPSLFGSNNAFVQVLNVVMSSVVRP